MWTSSNGHQQYQQLIQITVSREVKVVIVRQLDLQLPLQSVSIATKVVSSNPAYSEVYSIQHYLINLSVTCGALVSSTSKIDRHNITEIVLKVALNTITLTLKESRNQAFWEEQNTMYLHQCFWKVCILFLFQSYFYIQMQPHRWCNG